MIQITVYHSKLETAQLLSGIITAYFKKVRHSFNLNAYTKWEETMKHLRQAGAKADILILDCSDLSKAGALVSQLRTVNTRASWVCTDTDVEGLNTLMLTRPSVYLPELSDQRKIFNTIGRLDHYHQEQQRKNDFTFKCDGEHIRVPYGDIGYFESSAKKVTLYLGNSDKTYFFSAKLDDIEALLPDHFLRCHQSYLVNLRMIRHLDSKNHVFVLHSGEEILISRRSYTAAKEAYQSYLDAQQPVFA
jgi:DNA-binding LytR/AlgR family response regulator